MGEQGGIDLLLHGDSITDFWPRTMTTRTMFEKYFATIRTANSAISGGYRQQVSRRQGLLSARYDTFRPDLLHPIAKGYDIWGAAVKDKLAELMR